MSVEEIEAGYKQHAALTQLHRWYLYYEDQRYGIDNALDSLDPDVQLKSGLGEGRGHEQYVERVKKLPTTWKNAHTVKETDVTLNADGTIQLTAEITYLNQGLLPDNAVRTAELSYTTTLRPTDSVLPKFTNIEIGQNSDGTADKFESAYGENRILSLVHYWLALIEDPARDPDPVREILMDEFSLNFSSGAITDFDGFKDWLAGPGSSVAASTHKISNFSYEEMVENEYKAMMDFDWGGLLPDGTLLSAKTRHTWHVSNDPTERFPRIKSVDVEVLEPFAPFKQE